MKYFDKYTSNTCASSGNQLYFSTEGKRCTGRVFYKIFKGGEYGYSLLFSNIIDSTYADGDVSHKNLICGEWIIHSAKIGKCTYIHKDITDYGDISVSDFKDITFEGKSSKNVMPGEFFSTDPIKMEFKKGEYLCLEMTFSGTMLPYHEESLLPIYIKNGEKWEYNKKMPLPGMIGCDRPVKERVGYWGDSITQGYDAAHPNQTYVNLLADAWDASVLNQAIGGDVFCPENLDPALDFAPDIITVAYGTNDWTLQVLQSGAAGEYLDKLTMLYPGVPVFVLLPLWREVEHELRGGITLQQGRELLASWAENRENVFVIDCHHFVPFLPEYFYDGVLHPNDMGYLYYARALEKAVPLFSH